eukprot:2703517-Prymnesium_polylepis.1
MEEELHVRRLLNPPHRCDRASSSPRAVGAPSLPPPPPLSFFQPAAGGPLLYRWASYAPSLPPPGQGGQGDRSRRQLRHPSR